MANPVKVIKGAAKAAKLAKRINTSAAKGRQIGSPHASVNSKGKLKVQEYMSEYPVKGSMRKIKDNAQMVEYNAGNSKKITSLKYAPKSLRGIKSKTNKPNTPKVPVKKKAK